MDFLIGIIIENTEALFALYPWLPWIAMSVLGLMFGSFAGCVVYRLPLVLEHHWKNAAHEYFDLPATEQSISLVRPRSFCPHCAHTIAVPFLLPLFGYIFAMGRCRHCKKAISRVYPALELGTAVMFCWVYALFGLSVHSLVAVILGLCMLILVVIDARNHLLPDVIILPLLWLGLIANYFTLFVDFDLSFWGAITGYSFFFSLYWILYFFTGRESLGRGDIKLLAALGAWCGVWALPAIVFFASCGGLAWLLVRRLAGKGAIDDPLAFGPFLMLAGWISLVYGLDWLFDISLVTGMWQQL